MTRARYLVFGAILAIGSFAGAQTAQSFLQADGTDLSAGAAQASAQSQLLRILTPASSEPLANNSVIVRFELTNPGIYPGATTFLVQLDDAAPIRTTTTSRTFTGLAIGEHSVTIVPVDAYNTPIPGGRASVQFVVAPQKILAAAQGDASQPASGDSVNWEDMGSGKPGTNQNSDDLPKSSSPLPLISVIGFGILVGGIVSAMKTRS